MWLAGSVPIIWSLIEYHLLSIDKHFVNSYWYCSALNQFPVFYMGIVLYFQYPKLYGKSWYECAGKMLGWLGVFLFFWIGRGELVLSASIVCFSFGKACYWLWIYCYNYLDAIEEKLLILGKFNSLLAKYGEVSFFAFLVHGFFVRDLLLWLIQVSPFTNTGTYISCLLLVWILVYYTGKFLKDMITERKKI